MGLERDFSLSSRVENTRDQHAPAPPIQFSLQQIKDHFDQSVEQIRNDFAVSDELEENGKTEEAKNVLRSQIIFLEGILDFYIHEMSKYCLYRMFCNQWPKSEKYNSIRIPMNKVEVAISSRNSADWFFDYLNGYFEREVFLSAESMKDQLNLIGIGFGNAMHRAFAKPTENESQEFGKDIVKKLFQRRNEIAHQNDRSHSSAIRSDISKEYVETAFSNITSIAGAIFLIATEKETT